MPSRSYVPDATQLWNDRFGIRKARARSRYSYDIYLIFYKSYISRYI